MVPLLFGHNFNLVHRFKIFILAHMRLCSNLVRTNFIQLYYSSLILVYFAGITYILSFYVQSSFKYNTTKLKHIL